MLSHLTDGEVEAQRDFLRNLSRVTLAGLTR